MIFPGDPAVFATFAPRNPNQQVLPHEILPFNATFCSPSRRSFSLRSIVAVTEDAVKRYGGSTAPTMPWPTEAAGKKNMFPKMVVSPNHPF